MDPPQSSSGDFQLIQLIELCTGNFSPNLKVRFPLAQTSCFSLISLFSKLRTIWALLGEAEGHLYSPTLHPIHTHKADILRRHHSFKGTRWWLRGCPTGLRIKTIIPEPAKTLVHALTSALFPDSHGSVLILCISGHSIFHPFGNGDLGGLYTGP